MRACLGSFNPERLHCVRFEVFTLRLGCLRTLNDAFTGSDKCPHLLEFRYYDEVLTSVLSDVYKQLDRKRGVWGRWTLARKAANLNTIRLDYRELAERTENAIKFLSDMFYARVYRLAGTRIGVSDYRNLVAEKLNTARDLYDSMVNEFHQARAFFLELMVVFILVIEIVFLFRGKR
jgi:hypothetical protein